MARELAESGRLREAELVIRQARAVMTMAELCEARFHLLAAMLRADNWRGALPLMMANRRALRQDPAASVAAFAWLGLALARFARGRLAGAAEAAQRALTAAEEGQHRLAACLAGEILGPALMMTGQVVAGLEVLERALDHARQLQRTASVEHLVVQKQLLFARYAGDPKTALACLLRLAARLRGVGQRVSVLLECARIELILGHPATARQHWREAVSVLPSPAHRRVEAAVRARLAMLSAAEGAVHEALVIARAGLQLIDAQRDLIARAELLEITLAACRAIGHADEARAVGLELSRILRRTGFRLAPSSASRMQPVAAIAELNHRQMELISELACGNYIDIQWYVQRCGVSEVTAFRDLSALVKMGYLTRVGRARATRYTRAQNS